MRSEAEVRAAFDDLVRQRDESPKGSTARDTANQRVMALAWVLHHPKVDTIIFTQQALDLYKCLS